MPKLSVSDQIKILRAEFKETKPEIWKSSSHIENLDGRIKAMQTELVDFKDHLESSLDKWKSEIHNLIDSGFTSKAKVLDEEVGILNNRTIDLRNRTQKLEAAVFGKSI